MGCDRLMQAGGCMLLSALESNVVRAEAFEEDASAYRFDAAYIADFWRNTRGGLRTGDAYLGNLDLMLSVDGELAWGVPGLNAFAYVLYTHGDRLSERLVGDAMTLSNIDAPEAMRLYEFWFEWQGRAASAWSVRFGLYDLNSEFDMNDTRALFIHSTHGAGHDLAQTGLNGPSIFPVTALALRAAWAPRDGWLLLTAVFDGAPGDPDDPTRTRIHLSEDEGALWITELQWSSDRLSKLALGYWRYTSEFDDVRGEAPEWPKRSGNAGMYASAEVALGALNTLPPRASAFVRYGVAEGSINEFDRYAAVGVRYRGLFRSDGDDEIGLAFAKASTSEEARWSSAQGGALRNGYESAIELTYRVRLADFVALQPDVQYIVNPGADPQLDDSLVFGLRVEFAWAIAR
jgi:porin